MSTGFEGGRGWGGGQFEAEVRDGGGDDGVVEKSLATGVGDEEGDAQQVGGEAWEAAAGAEEELHGGVGKEVAGGVGESEGVLDHDDEGGAVEAWEELAGCDDTGGEGFRFFVEARTPPAPPHPPSAASTAALAALAPAEPVTTLRPSDENDADTTVSS